MSWVLVAVTVVWAFSLLFVVALCLSARRIDAKIVIVNGVPLASLNTSAEAQAGLDDIVVRRPAMS